MGRLTESGRAGIGALGKLPMFSLKKIVFASVDWAFMVRDAPSKGEEDLMLDAIEGVSLCHATRNLQIDTEWEVSG